MNKQITHQEYKDALLIVNLYRFQVEQHFKEIKEETKKIPPFEEGLDEMVFVTKKICSQRLYNALRDYYDIYINQIPNEPMEIKDLVHIQRKQFLGLRNVGGVLLKELNTFLHSNQIITNNY